jgi:hypothetical protein
MNRPTTTQKSRFFAREFIQYSLWEVPLTREEIRELE